MYLRREFGRVEQINNYLLNAAEVPQATVREYLSRPPYDSQKNFLGLVGGRLFIFILYTRCMPARGYLVGTMITTLLTLAAFLLVLFYFDPLSSGMVGVVLFFLSLGITLMGIITLIIFAITKSKFPDDPVKAYNLALRGGVLLGVVLISLSILKSLSVLSWWNTVMIVLVAVVLEIYFRVK